MPYMVAVALLDGEVGPAQYAPERIARQDVQQLLRKIQVQPDTEFSRRFPDEMPMRIRIVLRDGRTISVEKGDYEGFHTRPMLWDHVVEKYERLGNSIRRYGIAPGDCPGGG